MPASFVLHDTELTQPGFIHRPDRPNGAAIIIVNALHWDSVGPGRSMVEICNRLSAEGITAIRYEPAYDWIGSYDHNAIDWKTAVFQSLQQVITFVKSQPGIKRIHVLGYCLGAQFAFLNTAVHPEVNSLILVEIDIGMMITAPNLLVKETFAGPVAIRSDRKKRFVIYLRKLVLAETWAKAFSLKIDWKGIFAYLFERPAQIQGEEKGKVAFDAEKSQVEQISEMIRNHVGRCPVPILYFHNPFAAHQDKIRKMHEIIFKQCRVTYVGCTKIWGSLLWVEEIYPKILNWCKES
jgi:pimeloyl-ACP methyl ester carboxylesterase